MKKINRLNNRNTSVTNNNKQKKNRYINRIPPFLPHFPVQHNVRRDPPLSIRVRVLMPPKGKNSSTIESAVAEINTKTYV